jgi:hypothetical protein
MRLFSAERRSRRLALLVVAAFGLALALSGNAGAEVPELLTVTPEDEVSSSAAGHFGAPSGVATQPSLPGNVYVADRANERIEVLSPWGEFIRAFGWGVVDGSAELQTCTAQTGCQAGLGGSAAGELSRPDAVGADPAGDAYVMEASNHRLQKFDPNGDFLYAAGGDVVAHGPDDSGNDEVQELRVAATSGSFKLGFANPLTGEELNETAPLPYNASAAEVESALNGLSTISGLGGSVAVSGGPGDPSGSQPYTITFEGNLGGDEVPQLTVSRSGLGPAAIGGTLRCSTPVEAETIEFRWLRNGTPIPGAEADTYTTTAADEGKAIQCQVEAKDGDVGVIQAANPVYVAPPEGTPPPPTENGRVLAEALLDFGESLVVGGAGGQQLKCDPDPAWSGADAFAYRWYRNGEQIAGANEAIYTLTSSDLATPAYFQCAVTASNSGTASTTIYSTMHEGGKEQPLTIPAPFPLPGNGAGGFDIQMEPPTNVSTINQGGGPEICRAIDTCKSGATNFGDGEFGERGYRRKLAVSGSTGRVFVLENGGLFETPRIQVFNPDGSFLEGIALPKPASGIAIDVGDELHINFGHEIRELAPNGPIAAFVGPVIKAPILDNGTVTEQQTFNGVAVDSVGDTFSRSRFAFLAGEATYEYGPDGSCLVCGASGEGGIDGFDREIGRDPIPVLDMAAGSACGADDLYVSHGDFTKAYVKVFGDPPDPALCPPPEVPPAIVSQYAFSVGSSEAQLRAQINPRFWKDTTYYVEYGVQPCSAGGCQLSSAAPGTRLTTRVAKSPLTTSSVYLKGLEPGRTYYYRFVAQSGGSHGEPVRGAGGTVGVDGAEGTFITFRPVRPNTSCANQTVRSPFSAALPDCRAFEMVTPVEKNSGDIAPLGSQQNGEPRGLNQSSPSGSRLTFASATAFGEAQSAPGNSQFISTRGSAGWTTVSISPPQQYPVGDGAFQTFAQYRYFSPDLCNGWFVSHGDPPLTPDAVELAPNIYRRDTCGTEGYEAVTTVAPPHSEIGKSGVNVYYTTGLALQGVSADRNTVAYVAPDNLTTDAPDDPLHYPQLYVSGEGHLRFACVLPSGEPIAATAGCVAGTEFGGRATLGQANLLHALSADGDRLYWVIQHEGVQSQRRGLFLRVNPTKKQSAVSGGACTEPTKACTLPVSGTVTSDPKAETAIFNTASEDGRRAFFEVVKGPERWLYEYDATTRSSRLIARGARGVMGASDDGSRLYFLSSETLAAGSVQGEPNLYLYESAAGGPGSYTFIGALLEPEVTQGFAPAAAIPDERVSRVTADGLHAVFATTANPTGYDNADATSGHSDMEVYIYGAESDDLSCVSCNPSGSRPRGHRYGADKRTIDIASKIPGWHSELYPNRVMTEDGSQVFFESEDALALADSNGARDVYEWERPGAGDCTEESSAFSRVNRGCVTLISSGQSPQDSRLLDVSPDGKNVFFRTLSSLLPQDTGLIDIYDARVDGGFAPASAPPASCEGEACQGTPSPPTDSTPASSTFEGPGNVVGKHRRHRKHRHHKRRPHKRHHHHRRAGR